MGFFSPCAAARGKGQVRAAGRGGGRAAQRQQAATAGLFPARTLTTGMRMSLGWLACAGGAAGRRGRRRARARGDAGARARRSAALRGCARGAAHLEPGREVAQLRLLGAVHAAARLGGGVLGGRGHAAQSTRQRARALAYYSPHGAKPPSQWRPRAKLFFLAKTGDPTVPCVSRAAGSRRACVCRARRGARAQARRGVPGRCRRAARRARRPLENSHAPQHSRSVVCALTRADLHQRRPKMAAEGADETIQCRVRGRAKPFARRVSGSTLCAPARAPRGARLAPGGAPPTPSGPARPRPAAGRQLGLHPQRG